VADPPRLGPGVQGTLALVRHGESTWIAEGRFQGQADPPLSPAGIRQAELLAARLRDRGTASVLPLPATTPVGIWHSPLERAAETARRVSAAIGVGVPLHPDDDLAELAQGAWEGLTHEVVRSRYRDARAAWRRDPVHHHAPGGEPLEVAAERAGMALGRVLAGLDHRNPSSGAASDREPAEPVLGYDRSPEHASASTEPRWALVVAHDGILRLLLLRLLGLPLAAYWVFPFGLCAVSVVDLLGDVARLRAHNLAVSHSP
jgi:probable phosphoglycerate mutase